MIFTLCLHKSQRSHPNTEKSVCLCVSRAWQAVSRSRAAVITDDVCHWLAKHSGKGRHTAGTNIGLHEFIYLHIRVHYRPFNASGHTANANKSHLLVPQYPCSHNFMKLKGTYSSKKHLVKPVKLVNVRTGFKHSTEQKVALHWEFVSHHILSTHYFSICSYSISLR